MRTALITGASGFVGRALLERLAGGARLRAVVRRDVAVRADERVSLAADAPDPAWREALTGVDVVFHLAARVHQMRDTAADPLAEFRAVNAAWTERLATLAAASGVRRFVFLSSVKVHGDAPPAVLRETDAPAPQDPYGLSKWEAEQALAGVARRTGLRVAVLRPPLVYGPGVRANFLSLVRLVARGVPLPLGAIENRRSLVFVRNLADALAAAGRADAAAGTWLVSDGEDLSTPELVRRIARALGRPARLIPVPPAALRAGARLLGRGAAAQRLLGSLAVDSSALRRALDWKPPHDVDAGLRETAGWFLESA